MSTTHTKGHTMQTQTINTKYGPVDVAAHAADKLRIRAGYPEDNAKPVTINGVAYMLSGIVFLHDGRNLAPQGTYAERNPITAGTWSIRNPSEGTAHLSASRVDPYVSGKFNSEPTPTARKIIEELYREAAETFANDYPEALEIAERDYRIEAIEKRRAKMAEHKAIIDQLKSEIALLDEGARVEWQLADDYARPTEKAEFVVSKNGERVKSVDA